MTSYGDDRREMPHDPAFDDNAIDAILAGDPREGDVASLMSFVDDVRSVSGACPTPSAALAAALASGISPQAITPQSKWRTLKMKIQGFLAGLSVAGKLALGAGVAAAATTGAGAAGVLPGPVQHAFAKAVETITPFHVDDGGAGAGGETAGPPTENVTTTTIGDIETPTSELHNGDGDGTGSDTAGDHGDNGGVVPPTPTTLQHDGEGDGDHHEGAGDTTTTIAEGTTPTTEPHEGDGDHHGGDGETTTTVAETPTTEHHDGDNNNPQSMEISCVRHREPNHIECSWTASTNPAHHKYVLLRTASNSDHGQAVFESEDALSFDDANVSLGVGYGYRVISLDTDNQVESHSNLFTIECCGD